MLRGSMALAHLHYWSPALQKQAAMVITLPDGPGRPLPVVWLLHGLSDDCTTWQRRTSIERYAERHGVMVAMPEGGRSFWCDSALGAHEQHLLDSIAFVDRTFATIGTRAGRAIGGLSMGGYGALKLALKRPDLFCSVAVHSAFLDPGDRSVLADVPERRLALGDRPRRTEDPFALARAHARRRGVKPALRLDCGSGDWLLHHSRRFHAHLERLRVAHVYEEHPGGHDWVYWDRHIDAALAFHARCFAAARRPSTRRTP